MRLTGGRKRTLARGASVGVNAAGVGVMLATFAHTGGLTGAELGLAAGTAVLNQRLLEAMFGEAALVEMVGRARRRLGEALAASWAEEQERYLRLVPVGRRPPGPRRTGCATAPARSGRCVPRCPSTPSRSPSTRATRRRTPRCPARTLARPPRADR